MPAHAYREAFDEAAYDGDRYGDLRELLGPEYRHLPADQLDEALSDILGEMSAEDLENFWRGVRRFARRAAPILTKALPVVTTVAGTALGGPVGAALGGAAGQALSGALGGALKGGRGAGRRALAGFARGGLSGLGQAAGGLVPGGLAAGGLARGALSQLTGAGGALSQLTGAGGALSQLAGAGGRGAPAAQLLRLLTRPEMPQALLQMALGPAGAQHVRVGRTQVPLGAFTNALGVLAGQAAQHNHAQVRRVAARPAPVAAMAPAVASTGAAAAATEPAGGGVPTYLLDPSGQPLGDPADPASRTEALLLRLDEAEAMEALEAEAYDEEYDEAWDDTYDDSDDEADGEGDDEGIWEAGEEAYDDTFESDLDELFELELEGEGW